MRDLYTPAHFLIAPRSSRRRDAYFAAMLRYCALFREELFFTDRMIVHSDPLFRVWKSDYQVRELLRSEIVRVGSLEHWHEERERLGLPGLVGTAKIFDLRKISGSPKQFAKRLAEPDFLDYLNDLDAAGRVELSPMFERDEIFTNSIETGLFADTSDVISSLWRRAGLQLSTVDKAVISDELRSLLKKCKEAAGRSNLNGRQVLGIIHFYPETHVRAEEWGSFFYHLRRGSTAPLLREMFERVEIARQFSEWINANYIASEARTFDRGVILSEEFQNDENILAGMSLSDLRGASGDTKIIPLASIFLTPENVRLLTIEDIMEIRSSAAGNDYFELLRSIDDSTRADQIQRILEDYLTEIVRRIRDKRRTTGNDLNIPVAINIARSTNKYLIRIEGFLGDSTISSGISAGLSWLLPHPIPIQLIVRIGRIATAKAGGSPSEIRGELIVSPPGDARKSLLRLHSRQNIQTVKN